MLLNRTLPAGYMEIGESAAEGAIRETWEEANAEVEGLSPFAQLDIPLIGQVRDNIFLLSSYGFCVLAKDVCVIHYTLFGTDLHNILGKAQEAPVLTRSRIVRMPAFCPQ